MKILLFAVAAATLSGAALADDAATATKGYPVCSKTITDSCIEKSALHPAMHHKGKVTHRTVAARAIKPNGA